MGTEKSESKKLIPVYLEQLFLERTDKNHYVRMPEILEYLEDKGIYADRRTIYSAISLLGLTGFDIEGVQEKGGYKYHLAQRKFNTNELKVMIDSIASSKYLTERKSKELINKIKSLGTKYDSEMLNRGVLVGNRIKSMNDSVLKNLDVIYYAIANNRQITFQYTKWNALEKKLEPSKKGVLYQVSPFAITLNDNSYYVVCHYNDSKALYHFRVDKMIAIQVSENERSGIELFRSFDVSEYQKKTFGMFSGKEQTVRIQCTKNLAGVFIDRFGTDVIIRPDYDCGDSNHVRITIDVNTSPQFYAWIFSLGKDVKILAPESVIDEFKKQMESVVSNY